MPAEPRVHPTGEGWAVRGRVLTGRPGEPVIEDGIVGVAEGHVQWCGPAAAAPDDVTKLARPVPVILPGLVDVHCHGAVGHTFSADADGARRAAGHHAAQGTTSVIASLVSAPSEVLLEQITVLRDLVHEGTLAGLHLEGPFLSGAMCGAQDPAAIIDGDPNLLHQWLEAGRGTVRSITLAPETPHFPELVALCRAHRVVPSLGHTLATATQTRQALAEASIIGEGPWAATHLFNRMLPVDHRRPGPIPVLLEAARNDPGGMVLELIADGVHLDPEIVRMVFALVGPASIALITDAMAAAGMTDGRYTLGRLQVVVADGTARLAPTGSGDTAGAIAGSTSRLLENVRRCVEWGVPLPDAVAAATRTPAQLMGLTHLGVLAPGRRADLVSTTEDLEVLAVHRAGAAVTTE
ncbi:N-acetylglucosamine-6-phosphate deacetylase [Kocuria sp. M1R5S2]|uniref:N-acetylglucosamine-6-phosphate deacetylase n=1 Tax=Kocuria rhizosphaerae TaxID=3376285 RepID=UPI00379A0FAF